MTNTVWFVWLVFTLLFLVSPVGYGWSYRGWGPPFPRYIQRRRAIRASFTDTTEASRQQAWGIAGDFVWAMLLVAGCWAAAGLLWR